MFKNFRSKLLFLFIAIVIFNYQTWSQTKLQFKQWADPTENAFTLDVPTSWKISGGVKRASDTKAEIMMQSPDGQIIVKIGDVNIAQSFVELSPTLASLGYKEGQMASGTLQIRRFMSGTQFAASYLQWAVAQRCTNLQLVKNQDRNDYVQALYTRGMLPSYATAYTAGEVIYTCQSNGKNILRIHLPKLIK